MVMLSYLTVISKFHVEDKDSGFGLADRRGGTDI